MVAKGEASSRSKRGKNWNEPDSLKLLDAYQHVQSVKSGTPPDCSFSLTLGLLMLLDGDNSGIIFDKIAAAFAESSPEVEGRSTDAIKERWKKMQEAYRYLSTFLHTLTQVHR